MATKSFTTYRPTEDNFIELDDFDGTTHTFKLNPSIPGQIILDFMAVSQTEDPAKLAGIINTVLDLAIVEDDKAAWKEFSVAPHNGVTVDVLSEVVGHVVAVLSGGQTQE